MEVIDTRIPDVKIIRPDVHGDSRGLFLETWSRRAFAKAGIDFDFVQDNLSRSSFGTLRGLHYQIQRTQGKLLKVIDGCVFDVAVDLRQSSRTFGQWVGVTLSNERHELLWIPPGFAHGFLVVSETADVQYKCTDYYAPEYERTIIWNDPKLAIDWPLPKGLDPLLSPNDRNSIAFDDAETFP